MSAKIYAILGGGDWTETSVDHLILPDGMDIEEENMKYWTWYREVYWPNHIKKTPPDTSKVEFMSFPEWLEKAGARRPDDDELESFMDV